MFEGFASPSFLAALAGISIPVIIHIISRRRAIIMKFAAWDFVMRSNKKIVRRLKLKQMILLLARCLAVALLALGFASPVTRGQTESAGAGLPADRIIVLDESYSMGYALPGGTIFEKAREKAKAIARSMKDGDRTGVMECTGRGAEFSGLLQSREEVLKKLEAAKPRHSGCDLASCIDAAFTALGSQQGRAAEVAVLTDMTAPAWRASARWTW
jgi:hypothetical protein